MFFEKKFILCVFVLMLIVPSAFAYQWNVDEYIDNCSIVHQKKIYDADKEILGYCMGVLKGAFAGILVARYIQTDDLEFPECMLIGGQSSFWELQKNVLAYMRLNDKKLLSSTATNTANYSVAMALIELYPCLLE